MSLLQRVLLLAAGAALGAAFVLGRSCAPPSPPRPSSGPPAPPSPEARPTPGVPAPQVTADALAEADAGVGADRPSEAPGAPPEDDTEPGTLKEQRERLFARLLAAGVATPEEVARARAIFDRSPILGQGNPAVTQHPMTRAECRARRARATIVPGDPAICGEKFMVPIFDPAAEPRAAASVCIDQYEFPGIPCEYPVTNVRADEAAALCQALGKRLCDAHEWEGACAGALHPAESEYTWGLDRRTAAQAHNKGREILWAYGPKKDHTLCGTASRRSEECRGGGYGKCGSNTYPAGAFPDCRSPFGVYDQHGNAAEHMNLPTRPEERMSRGLQGGFTEMKGSWFIFSHFEAHPDDCRWREPRWHESRVSSPRSHHNYHLGFRCCKDIP